MRRRIIQFSMIILIIITILFSVKYLGEQKIYIPITLIMLETFGLFFLKFENRKPNAKEIVLIAVLCALCVASRIAFAPFPNFKPMLALIILAGVSFGAETGFLVGAAAAFASNIYFGQGPWTVWQMFACALVGFLGGVFFSGKTEQNALKLCVFGALSTYIIYSGIVNFSFAALYNKPTLALFLASEIAALPFDITHTSATVIFLAVLQKPLLRTFERAKKRLGIS
ncbi:hypothetical protein FACS1894188_11370 [Clostridia bacterium]|nr:hypothetical protein FACS1894188_11370 [Clostridia bacterium]